MKDLFSYVEQIKKEFGRDVEPRNHNKYLSELSKKKETVKNWNERLTRDKARYDKAPNDVFLKKEYLEALDGFEKVKADYEEYKDALLTGDVFYNDTRDMSIGLIRCPGGVSLADLYGVEIDTKGLTTRIIVENYNDTTLADVVTEGEDIAVNEALLDHVRTVCTDRTAIKEIASILKVPEKMLIEDRDLLNDATDSVQAKFKDNTENYLLCKAIQESRDAVVVTPGNLFEVANTSLCGKAKRNAEIIVNDTSFNKLDIEDSNGNPLLKKDFTINEFVFKDRYIVRILSDDILPNNEDGTSPIYVGAWADILRLATLKEYPPLKKTDLGNYAIENRNIAWTIPLVIATPEDKAHLVGYME